MNNSAEFGDNLKFLRKIKNISQQQLADKLKIDRSTISRWENGEIEPSVSNAVYLANVFGVPVESLIGQKVKKNVLNNDEFLDYIISNYHYLNEDDKDIIKYIIEKRIK